MKKRLFSFLLALCMIVSVFPVMAFAEETEDTAEIAVVAEVAEATEAPAETEAVVEESAEPVVLTETEEEEEEEPEETEPEADPTSGSCGENATWSISEDMVLTISGSGPMEDYETWRNVPWGYCRESIKKVVITDGITSIGDFAFNGCNGITQISIPNSVVEIGMLSMSGCKSLTSVNIPEGVTVIEEGTFGSSGLTEVDLPDSLTRIGNMAFHDTYLSSVVIPASVTWIGEMAFGGAMFRDEPLKKITFLGDAPNMMDGAFSGVSATAYYPAGNATWTSEVLSGDYTYGDPLNWVAYTEGEGMIPPTVKASNVTSTGKIRLTWAKVDGAVKYEIYRASSENGTYARKYTTTGTQYTNTGAKAGETYYYYVMAIGEDGETAKSAVVSRSCTLAQPAMKIGNVASTGKIRLTWEAVEGAVKYEVYRADSKDGEYTLKYTTTGTAYTNTGAKSGESYYYKVMAIAEDPAYNSAFSVAKVRTCDLPRPTATVSNDAATGRIVVKWERVNGANGYYVYRATSEDGSYYVQSNIITGTSYTDTTAKPGVKYYYKVKAAASDSAADSANSVVKARVCDLAQPEINVGLNSKGKPRVTWTAIEGAAKYEIYRSTSLNGTYKRIYTTTSTQFNNSGAAEGVTYYYKVRAVHTNSSGNSAFSVAKCAAAPLEAPEVSITLSSKGKPKLSWDKVEGAVQYEVYRSENPNANYTRVYTTTGSGYTNTGAKAGTTYYYKVKAIAGEGASDSQFSEMKFISCTTVGISDSVAARAVVNRINEWREELGLEKLDWYEEGLDAAKIRAAELKVLPSVDERPDGSSPENLWEDYGVAVEMCLVTQSNISAEDLVDAMMLTEELYDYGIVCLLDIWSGAVAVRNGDYWVIMFAE